jgi:hypothetical protein
VDGRRCEPPLPASGTNGAPVRPYEPPLPPRKAFDEQSHALIGFHLGFPGDLDQDGRSGDLDSTLGFNLRADAPLGRYVLLGPMLQFGSWQASGASGHNYYVDLDLLLRLRVPITTSTLSYQLWLGMPIGVSIDLLSNEGRHQAVGLGWNIGVLFGGAVHFSPKFGLFAETGWEQHRIAHGSDVLPDLDLKLQQALLNVGFVIKN